MKLLYCLLLAPAAALAAVGVDLTAYRAGPIRVTKQETALVVEWNDESSRPWRAVFSLNPEQPLIREITSGPARVIENATPLYAATTGKRRGGWDAFFDHPGRRPEEIQSFTGKFRLTAARARTTGNRVEVAFDGLEMGLFSGALAYTFFPNSRLVKQEALVKTSEPDVAYFYNAGIRAEASEPRFTWYDTSGQRQSSGAGSSLTPIEVRYRALAAESGGASFAVFPAPHQYFFARDVTTNLGYLWRRAEKGFLEMGIRQLTDDGTRYYPWMNAPPGTEQRLAMFLLLGTSGDRLAEVLRYTNQDRFPALPGYQTMATHWHFGYSVLAMRDGFDKVPFFKPVLKQMGVNIAMIMEFHGDGHPGDTGNARLEELDAMFRVCREHSDREFLILPAEEANVYLGGHWTLFFPHPVWWYHRRPEGRPFVAEDPRRGKVYSIGSSADMLELVRREQGFMWQTHPRTKGYVFKIDETHELYAHMNVNYLRLPSLPAFEDYTPVARALEKGDYFITTGEVLIPEHSITPDGVRARVRWTFPLALAEIVWGDGAYTKRHLISLHDTASFGESSFDWKNPAKDWKWMRLAVWDTAGNGAFTMPVRR
ncbi:MAG: hypothetical protein HY238_02615 [Acidobacteria bacterium]|nr:hypothetical protein [Acidobacteriota bacterium]